MAQLTDFNIFLLIIWAKSSSYSFDPASSHFRLGATWLGHLEDRPYLFAIHVDRVLSHRASEESHVSCEQVTLAPIKIKVFGGQRLEQREEVLSM